jgi:hypothetical protein
MTDLSVPTLQFRQLWAAVLLEGLRCSLPEMRTRFMMEVGPREAFDEDWIGSFDFELVCDLAGVDAVAVADGIAVLRRHPEDLARLNELVKSGALRDERKAA